VVLAELSEIKGMDPIGAFIYYKEKKVKYLILCYLAL